MADTTEGFEPTHIAAEDLDDRQIRGVSRAKAADRSNGMVVLLNESTSLWMSKRGNRAWRVEREQRNRHGKLRVEYTCKCGDHDKNPRLDCEHIFAEKLRRGEVIVDGQVEPKRAESAKAGRLPARKRIAPIGRTMRTVQRDARVAMGDRIPELLRDLARAMEVYCD
ncbi:MAG TPA: hypothetical protein VHT05_05145 [Candidatus Elarobacter sp.]|jgi:hypothetical protein|nr:hypothetical protein [Candidatus Elarobacter sp.]